MSSDTQPRIFLDYAAATPVSAVAREAYAQTQEAFANPQALYAEGLAAARIRDDARRSIAQHMAVKSRELTFTSGGTEGNNLAIAGFLLALEAQGAALSACHVVLSSIEHPSVADVVTPFVRRGLAVDYVAPSADGTIRPEAVAAALKPNTVLVSVALVNSEIGTIQPLHAIGQVVHQHTPRSAGVPLPRTMVHTDACQAALVSLVPHGLNVDLMTLDSGKCYGPRGVGVLYAAPDVTLEPVIRGGSQENGLRPGTENTALIAGFAAAFDEVTTTRTEQAAHYSELRVACLQGIRERFSDAVINGTAAKQSPHIVNVSIPDIDAEYIALYVDQRGVALSTKSACLERADQKASHVVAALTGTDDAWRAQTALRLSFGRATMTTEIERALDCIAEGVKTYRSFATR